MQATVLAGSGSPAFGDGRGAQAHFNSPCGVALDCEGNVIVADQANHRIRKISADGTVTTLAGSGNASFLDGQGVQAHFNSPGGVAVDCDGNIFVADQGNHRIRKISADGSRVTTLAGSGSPAFGDGRGDRAHFYSPCGVAVDRDGNVIVADVNNHRIRKISADGTVTTLAGSGSAALCDGQGAQAHFYSPYYVAVDCEDNVFVADRSNKRIRKISQDGTVTTLCACSGPPSGVALDGDGNLIVAEDSNRCIKIAPDGSSLALAGNITYPRGVALDDEGNVIVTDHATHCIFRIPVRLAPRTPLPRLPPQLPSAFVSQMEAMLKNETLTDVTFVVEDTRIKAHRAILVARSEYFRTMLLSNFSEGQKGGKEITIGDTTPEAFRSLLRYVYTDELIFADEHLIDVMRKAKEISLERVYNYTVRRCHSHISVHNVVGWFVKADQYGLEDLRSATFRFLTRNFRKVRAQAKGGLQVLADKPNLMMEVMLEAI